MPIKTNYHTHCYLDDGARKPEEYVEQALNEGFSVLGFSCHAPLPFLNEWTLTEEKLKEYLEIVRGLKETYRDRIEICLGLEIDYIPGKMGPSSDWVEPLGLDYTIGSVHMLEDPASGLWYGVDGPDSEFLHLLDNVFHGDIRAMVKEYFRLEKELLREHSFDILGHCDLMKKKNRDGRYFDESSSWYREESLSLLEAVAAKGVIMEVNTGGIARGYHPEFYPGLWMLEKAAGMGIPVTLNSDAHNPEKISTSFSESLSIIRQAGYTGLSLFQGGRWSTQPIDPAR